MLKGDFVLAGEGDEAKRHLVIDDGRTTALCGVGLETFGNGITWVGQVRCRACLAEYSRHLKIKGDLE